MPSNDSLRPSFELVLKRRRGWQPINFREIWLYRELFAFLVWRDVKIRYRQTTLGVAWAVLQPLLAMLIFTIFFHRLAGVTSEEVPYPLFAYCGMLAWSFFSNAVSASSNSLVGNRQLISKVYFPRIFIPLGSVGALLFDLFVSCSFVGAMLVYFRWPLSLTIAWLPLFILGAFLFASGVGLILSSLNAQFRDIKYVVPFLIQMWLFVTPVIYPVKYVPESFRALLGLNPMSGIVVGFRHALLGTPPHWTMTATSLGIAVIVFVAGAYLFRHLERRVADIV